VDIQDIKTVSVWITTYNHEKYIAQAIESVLAQITDFSFEIILAEDYSTDHTRAIVKSYHLKYPDKIKLYLSEQNTGCNPIFYATYHLCTGKYVAWLDGDDYWTDQYKLQKQIDILEKKPEVMFCFHKVTFFDEIDNNVRVSINPNIYSDNTWDIHHFIHDINPINTPSFVCRNLNTPLPSWFYKLSIADSGYYFLLLQFGKGYYLEDNMAVYRIHNKGTWSGSTLYEKNLQLALFNERMYQLVPDIYKAKISSNICFHNLILFEFKIVNGEFKESLIYLNKLKKYGFVGLKDKKKRIFKIFIKFTLFPFFNFYKYINS
jgi:glycosyltransferase involved in cell wall biosynthesis